jgi:hypothetical protein
MPPVTRYKARAPKTPPLARKKPARVSDTCQARKLSRLESGQVSRMDILRNIIARRGWMYVVLLFTAGWLVLLIRLAARAMIRAGSWLQRMGFGPKN